MPATLEETVNVSAQQLQLMLKRVMRLLYVLHGELQKSVVSIQQCEIYIPSNPKNKLRFHRFSGAKKLLWDPMQ